VDGSDFFLLNKYNKSFYEKNSNVFKLGPQSVGRFHQMGACQAAKKVRRKKKSF
jgi:hypothetical protein